MSFFAGKFCCKLFFRKLIWVLMASNWILLLLLAAVARFSKPTTTTYSNLIMASLYVSVEGNLPTKMREANVICVRLKGSQALFINGWENTSWGQLLNEKSIKYNFTEFLRRFTDDDAGMNWEKITCDNYLLYNRLSFIKLPSRSVLVIYWGNSGKYFNKNEKN